MFIKRAFSKKLKFFTPAFLVLLLAITSIAFGTIGSSASRSEEQTETTLFSRILTIKPFSFLSNGEKTIAEPRAASPDSIFVVNNDGDSDDINAGDGICLDSAGNCTLRAAVQEANAYSGTDEITFNLPLPAIIQLNTTEINISEALTITGSGARLLTIRGNSNTANGILNVGSTVTTTANINGLTLADSSGRGIVNNGRLSLSDVVVKGNATGIYDTGRLNLNRVLVNNNTGSGIYLTSAATLVNISDTTITNNSSADFGGGIYSASADVTLNNVTISNNTAATSGGGFYYTNSAAGINVRNTIIADNTATNGPDVFNTNIATGTLTSRGNNLIGKNFVGSGFVNSTNNDQVGTVATPLNPQLGPLQNNGGPTDTRAILTNSPAKNAGNTCVVSANCPNSNPSAALSNDQRGTNFPRFYESAVEIGAFELFYPAPTISSLSPNPRGTGTDAFELTVNGSGFVADSIVKYNGQNKTTIFVSNTQLKAQLSASDVATAGQYPIIVTNPTPGGGDSDPVNLNVTDCSYSINPTSQNLTSAGGALNVAVTTSSGCIWTAAVTAGNSSWISITSGASGSGSGTVGLTVALNNGPQRIGTVTIAGKTFTVTQDGGCTYTISSNSQTFTSAGGSSTVAITTPNQQCQWAATVAANSPWITITSGASGTGNGTVAYTVANNNGPQRSGTLTIGGQTFTITQQDGCTYTLSPNNQNFTSTGGSNTVAVTPSNSGCQWVAVSNDSWLTITSGASGTGNGTVAYTVAANTGPNRSGTLTIGGKTFTVTQDSGCTFTISPTSQSVPNSGGTVTITVTTPNQQCQWTATVAANSPWITITSGAGGTGNGTVTITVAANTGSNRSGTLTIGGQTFTVSQQDGCTYTISPNNQTFTSTGGSSTVAVTPSSPSCQWTATVAASSPWITIANGTTGTGNGTVAYTVASNSGPQRIGTITINGQTLTITQQDGCTYTISPLSRNFTLTGGSSTVAVTASNPQCQWAATVAANSPWITITSGASGTGNGTVAYTVASNNGPQRNGTIIIGGQTFTVTQDSGCTYTISPNNQTFTSTGGSSTVAVTTSNPQCQWAATVTAANSSWVTITSGASGTGSGTVAYTVASNSGPQRTGTIIIGGQTLTITQQDGCTFTIAPTSATVPASGGTGSVAVTASNPQCQWAATVTAANSSWVTITSGASGTGNGTVIYSVALNSGAARTGTIIIGGQTFTINQLSLLVTNLNDGGAGSLRQAVLNANATSGNDIITIQASLTGTITLTGGEIAVNSSGGALEIRGPGADKLTVSGNDASRIFYSNKATLTISGMTLTRGNGVGARSFDTSIYGGAVYADEGTLKLIGVHVTGNTLTVPDEQGNRTIGGGVYIYDGTGHTIENSTFSNNNAMYAGGLYTQGVITIKNSTFSGNFSRGDGAGILTQGITDMRNVTVTNNKITGSIPGGAGISVGSGTLTFTNTIVAGNIGLEIGFLSGEVSSNGNNLIGDAPGDSTNTQNSVIYQPSDILDTPPRFGTLAMYGGPMPTEVLLPNSPAIDHGNNANAPATTDQRGAARIVNNTVDIGAYEFAITLTPAATALPNGRIGEGYSTEIKASRADGSNPNEPFTYSIAGGAMPGGIILDSGIIYGTPTTGGLNTFVVRATGADGMSGANKYTINVVCALQIDQNARSVAATLTTGTINVTTAAGCPWTAVSSVPWITVTTGSSGAGNGAVQYSVAANTGLQRMGMITIGDKTFTVTQAGGCTFTLNPPSQTFLAPGGTVNVTATASNPQCPWTATANDPWIYITGSASGTGNGTVAVTADANAGNLRFGSATIGGQSFLINQNSGCAYSITPTTVNMPNSGGAGGFTVTTATGCPWTASTTNSWITITSGGGGTNSGNGSVAYTITANTGSAKSGSITVTGGLTHVINQAGNGRTPYDLDGDGKADLAVFRPASGIWYWTNSTTGFGGIQFGANGDKLVPADYDGDGKMDVAVYRDGNWYIQRSTQGFINIPFGTATDVPFPADYDGDGKADIAVYRASIGTWYIQRSTAGFFGMQFGSDGDKPIVGDFDGDGKADLAVFRPSNGIWYMQQSTAGFKGLQFGSASDRLVPADYDGDGKTDIAVYRPSEGAWYINRSQLGFTNLQFGASTDLPVPADYDGDGKADIAVYRSGIWYIQRSTQGFLGVQFGDATDKPAPNALVP